MVANMDVNNQTDADMNRFAAATLVNFTADGQPSYKAALLTVLQQQKQGGADEEWLQAALATAAGGDNDLRPDKAIDYTEMRSKDYTDGPGEMDMLIGFFLMNGVCVVFFLAFGLCVICSCMRRKPKFQNPEEPPPIQKTPLKTPLTSTFAATFDKLRPKSMRKTSPRGPSPTPNVQKNSNLNFSPIPPPITSPSLKPTFKAIVARAMQQQQMAKMPVNSNSKSISRSASNASRKTEDKTELLTDKGQVQVESVDEQNPESPKKLRDNPKSPLGAVAHQETEDDTASTATSVDENPPPSIIRQNLLGPLTFDDLYYT
ncbi:unnamed protein product [Bursaphelenchus xylophilus]|uniref:(pine wood nematode) hypothetical protein n=1 Tax=Bursaphelenchus xylophilus TaxID=6326 RepID=A0A1I7RSY0_BURXY|nr:unnamed protein product [Bursaphelenchus xylophilus]CAG9122743.1 unnamed protein product [Bursaphelenchus xylophilus]